MSDTDSNEEMSYDQDLEISSFSVSSAAVASIAAVLLDLQVRKKVQRRFRRSRKRSRGTRHVRGRKRRSVEDIYNELGPMYFRRAYRMQYSTFTTTKSSTRLIFTARMRMVAMPYQLLFSAIEGARDLLSTPLHAA